ncbi:hypothetical protein HZC00_03380 [Candidatus Kaiserbacteria bacterium]|nr:hypothetical protein [Candidatus Kaiserbacteria bacterium]
MDRMERMRRPLRAPETGGGSDECHDESDFARLERLDQEQMDANLDKQKGFLAEVKMADPERQKQLALNAIAEGDGWMVANNPFDFKSPDKELLLAVIKSSEGHFNTDWIQNASNLYNDTHNHLLDNEIANAIVTGGSDENDTSKIKALAFNIQKFINLDDRVARCLIQDDWRETVTKHLDSFMNLNQGTFLALWSLVDEVFEYVEIHDLPRPSSVGDRDNILDHIKKFTGLDGKALRAILETEPLGRSYITFDYISNIDLFGGVTHDDLAALLVQHGAWRHLAHRINDLTVSDKASLLRQFTDNDHQDLIIENIDKWNDVMSKEQVQVLFDASFKDFVHNSDVLEADDDGFGYVEGYYDDEMVPLKVDDVWEKLNRVRRMNDAYDGKLDLTLSRLMKDYDEWPGMDVYNEYKELMEGKVSQYMAEIGVTHPGETGLAQVAEHLRQVRGKIIREQYDPAEILKNPLVTAEAMSTVRYRSSEFGRSGTHTFRRQIGSYIQKQEASRSGIQPLLGLTYGYTPSEVLSVAKVDREREEEFKHTEDFLSRYGRVVSSLAWAQDLLLNAGSRGLGELRADVEKHIREYIDRMSDEMRKPAKRVNNKGEALPPLTPQQEEQRLRHIGQTIERLQNVLDRDPSLQEQFNILRSVKGEFDDDLMRLMFFLGFRYNRQHAREPLPSYSVDHPTTDQITWVMNFVDHIVNQETLAKYFTDKKAAKAFRDLIDLSSLEHGLARMQNALGSGGSMQIQFLPTRGLLAEFSGQVADACWATTAGAHFLEENPNFTALMIVQNPHTAHERLAGAALLIQTMSAANEPLLVIRGLNPIQNVINQLDVKDFYTAVTDYLKTIAERQDRKLAIVIDDHSGGSATNRPVLFSYLEQLKPTLQKVRLKSEKDTTFNDYNIVNDCYFVGD